MAHDDGIMAHGGATMAQLYTGANTGFTQCFPMSHKSQMTSTLPDFIHKYRAPNTLVSNNAKTQIGKQVNQILKMYAISDFQCEPNQQNQNPAACKIQEVMKLTNAIFDCIGTPAKYWFLFFLFVWFLMNCLAMQRLNWETPIQGDFGQKPDISLLLQLHLFEPVYSIGDHSDHSYSYPSNKKLGCWDGVAGNKGNDLPYWILTDDTEHVISRSAVRSVLNTANPNTHADMLYSPGMDTDSDHSDPTAHIKSTIDYLPGATIDPGEFNLPKLSPDELLGTNFLKQAKNLCVCAEVIKRI